MEIVNSAFTSHYLDELGEYFESMWGEKVPFDVFKLGLDLPCPIIALEDEVLIAGLSFTAYDSPEESSIALWINAIYVTLAYRKEGLASKLIQVAEKSALEYGHSVLYANTNVPRLYLKLGWTIVKNNGKDQILKKKF